MSGSAGPQTTTHTELPLKTGLTFRLVLFPKGAVNALKDSSGGEKSGQGWRVMVPWRLMLPKTSLSRTSVAAAFP